MNDVTHADALVIGLGTVGSMALWRLSELGLHDLVGIEQFGIPHAFGSYGGESRWFRVAYHEDPAYVPLILEAREQWFRLQREAGRELFLPTGVLTIGTEDAAGFANVAASVERYELPSERLSSTALASRFPQHVLGADDEGIVDLLGGALRPEAAVLSAVELAQGNGARVIDHTRVDGIEEHGDGVTVRTSAGIFEAEKVIVAGGSWTSELIPAIDDISEIHPFFLAWYLPRDVSEFSPTRFMPFLRDLRLPDGGNLHGAGLPSLDGYCMKLGFYGKLPGIDSIADLPRLPDEGTLDALGDHVRRFLRGVIPSPIRISMHHDVWTAHKTPVIDLSESGRVVTLAGFSGHGFKMSPAIGGVAANLVMRGADPHVREGDRFSAAGHRRS